MKKLNVYVLMVFALVAIISAQSNNGSTECHTPDNGNGVCIDLRICQPLRTLLETRRHVQSVKIRLQKSFCGYTDVTSPKVCCPVQSTDATTSERDESDNTTTVSSNKTGSNTVHVHTSTALPSQNECGNVSVNRDRIIGGVPSVLGAWPWIAAIGYRDRSSRNDSPLNWNCGGVLISNRYVVTAAHCLVNNPRSNQRPVVVRLGDLDLNPDVDDQATPVDVPIERVITHERYFRGGKNINDIGLLKLKHAVNYTRFIQPICLPSASEMNDIDYKKNLSTVAGWGTIYSDRLEGQSKPANTRLMEVEIPFASSETCKQAFVGERSAEIDDTVLCAGFPDGGQDSCRGDSGGPLMMVSKRRRFYLMGIVSYGPVICGTPGVPGVYTRVRSFVEWIAEKINDN